MGSETGNAKMTNEDVRRGKRANVGLSRWNQVAKIRKEESIRSNVERKIERKLIVSTQLAGAMERRSWPQHLSKMMETKSNTTISTKPRTR